MPVGTSTMPNCWPSGGFLGANAPTATGVRQTGLGLLARSHAHPSCARPASRAA